jgi:hypothetical protein
VLTVPSSNCCQTPQDRASAALGLPALSKLIAGQAARAWGVVTHRMTRVHHGR